ncbi:PTR2-domain-containing protein [Conidiobolus coronatus NRRL 28638]|uniref:PTR2-domain-containing protein n=1 Tax=Conidiobolus coronatus (strain ATCC 28846 / CBS 209.66 / NRRL 28638) TaxID=796925 RepID=A0A137P9U7_CONC2|nr:PTR2-domain-containing protein [Conidiobolus coronatus NRRL 28638]|eukprot:KXN71769.1 PTR2-domain-containing protein [Conidiobolus coronatus NRRL 28638]
MTRDSKDLETTAYKSEKVVPGEDAHFIYGPIPSSAWIVIVTELCERLSFYGASLMFIPYLVKTLGYSTQSASAINRGFTFFAYFTVIFGASLADGYVGKYKAIVLSAIWYIIGLVILAATASPAGLAANCGTWGFIVASYIFIAFGMGGIKSNVSAFAALQVPAEDVPTGRKPNEFYGHNLTVERIFRFFYWSINLGAFVGQIVCPILSKATAVKGDAYLNHGNYGVTYGFPACVFVVGTIVFALGKNKFKDTEITVNPLTKALGCIKYAIANRGSNPDATHFLDNAKVSDKVSVGWDHQFVEDLKKSLRACKAFAFYGFYWALYNNMSDSFIIQGMRMQRPEWLSSEQLNVVNSLVLVIFLPIFDYLIFPGLRKLGVNLGPLRRICIGFTLCTLSMVLAAIFQSKVYASGPYYDFSDKYTIDVGVKPEDVGDLNNDFTIWWQIIVYFLMAVSEIFASATGLEFAFKYASEELKSFVLALFLFTNCIGSLLGMIVALGSADPYYTWLFTGEAAVMGVVTIIFIFLFFNKDEE